MKFLYYFWYPSRISYTSLLSRFVYFFSVDFSLHFLLFFDTRTLHKTPAKNYVNNTKNVYFIFFLTKIFVLFSLSSCSIRLLFFQHTLRFKSILFSIMTIALLMKKYQIKLVDFVFINIYYCFLFILFLILILCFVSRICVYFFECSFVRVYTCEGKRKKVFIITKDSCSQL